MECIQISNNKTLCSVHGAHFRCNKIGRKFNRISRFAILNFQCKFKTNFDCLQVG